MGFFRRLFGGRKSAPARPPDKVPEAEMLSTENNVECPHTSLSPSWDNAADMGQHDKITGYRCGGCMRVFTVEEHDALLATEATRLAWMKDQPAAEAPTSTGQAEGPPPGS
jgi:hypothetical protein